MSADPFVFRFDAPGLNVEFEGPEAFVEAQIERLSARIQKELDAALARRTGTSAPAQVPAAPPAADQAPESSRSRDAPPDDMTITDFYKRARSREGRGAMQETVLIFAYYLRDLRGQPDFSISELSSCFALTGATPPSSLANTLGIMKRTQGVLESGTGRGRYALTDKGAAYVRRLIGAQ